MHRPSTERIAASLATAICSLCFLYNLSFAQEWSASGFVGLNSFPSNSELGNSWMAEQVPRSSFSFGGRAARTLVPAIAATGLSLALEGELRLAASFTQNGVSIAPSYFSPVVGWRSHLMLRSALSKRLMPHVIVGGGGETVVSSSPYMADETDGLVYWGLGATFGTEQRGKSPWSIRVDARQGFGAGRGQSIATTFEVHLGVQWQLFATKTKRKRAWSQREKSTRLPRGLGGPGDLVGGQPPPELGRPEDLIVSSRSEATLPSSDLDASNIVGTPPQTPTDPESTTPAPAVEAQLRSTTIEFAGRSAKLNRAARNQLSALTTSASKRDATLVVRASAAVGQRKIAVRRAESVKWALVDLGFASEQIQIELGGAVPSEQVIIEIVSQ